MVLSVRAQIDFHKYSCYVFFWKVYYRVDESKEKENDDLVGANETRATNVLARHVEEENEGLAGGEEENDIAAGKISKTEDDIDMSKIEDGDVDSNKIEDIPVRETRERISDWVENLYAFINTLSF